MVNSCESDGRETRLSVPECEAVQKLSTLVRLHGDPHDLVTAISPNLRPFTRFDALAISRVRDERDLEIVFSDLPGGVRYKPPIDVFYEGSMTQWVLDNSEPLTVDEIDREKRFPAAAHIMRELGFHSVFIFPMSTPHRRIGAFCLACERPDAFSGANGHFLSFFADQIAIALDDAFHSQELRQAQADLKLRNNRLQLLLELSNLFVETGDLKTVLRGILGKLKTALDCGMTRISLNLDPKGEPRVYVADSDDSIADSGEGEALGGQAAQAYKSGKVICLQDSDHTPGFAAECHIPLIRSESSLGLLSLFWKVSTPLAAEYMDLLSGIAQQMTVALERAFAFSEIKTLKDQLTAEKLYLEDEIRSESNFDEIIGQSAALKKVLRHIEVVAPTDSTVLICGDTGTGKELIARAIHHLSSRSKAPFVKLNCAAIPTGLLESELFGHERGAFTGAIAQRIGRFELASRGTVFLDEIGEIPLELQPKLLRVLQEREFERLGNSRTLSTGARLIAASNRDLAAMVDQGKFRADLYYRLNVFPVTMPGLSQRRDDIPLLVRFFVRGLSRKMHKVIDTIPAETMSALMKYNWPGNIRELQNVLERAVILSPGPVLQLRASDLPETKTAAAEGEIETLENAERKHILRALKHTNGVVAGPGGAAALLGLKRSTLQARMQRLGLQRR